MVTTYSCINTETVTRPTMMGRSEVETHIGVVTLNRPEVLNALNLQLVRELDQAITDYEEDDSVGAVIITGAGERAFSAGADIHENRELGHEERNAGQAERAEYTWHLHTSSKPIIGAVNGLCYGGGTVLATSLDFLVGCEKSSFRFLAVNYGQMNATWSLPQLVGIHRAKELLLSGREVFAEEAYHMGLINHLVPSEELMDRTLDIARRDRPPTGSKVWRTSSSCCWNIPGCPSNSSTATKSRAGPAASRAFRWKEGFSDFLSRKGRKPRSA